MEIARERKKKKRKKKKEKNNKSEGDSKELQKPKAAQNIKQKLDTLCKEKKSSNRQTEHSTKKDNRTKHYRPATTLTVCRHCIIQSLNAPMLLQHRFNIENLVSAHFNFQSTGRKKKLMLFSRYSWETHLLPFFVSCFCSFLQPVFCFFCLCPGSG